jgi:hypothetical protein
MAEMYRGHTKEAGSGPREDAITMDVQLSWLRPHHQPRAGAGHWSPVDQALVDLHARYERACIED